MRMVIELKRDANPQVVLNRLFSQSQLQTTFSINMLALVDNQHQPKILSLRHIIDEYLAFQEEIIVRRTRYDLKKAQERAHLLEGLLIAQDNIDEVIRIIRTSYDNAKENLMQRFGLDDVQAQAILDMRLYKLIGLEIEALIKEHEETIANIYRYEDILERKSAMAQVIINELDALKKEYSQKRRTVIDNCEEVVFEEKKIEEAPAYCLIDRFGYTRCVDVATFERNQEAAFAENRFVFLVKNTGRICLFTNTGQLYTVKVSDLPFGKFRDKAIPPVSYTHLTLPTIA